MIEYFNYLNNLTIYCVPRAVYSWSVMFELCWRHVLRYWITPPIPPFLLFRKVLSLISFQQLFHISKMISRRGPPTVCAVCVHKPSSTQSRKIRKSYLLLLSVIWVWGGSRSEKGGKTVTWWQWLDGKNGLECFSFLAKNDGPSGKQAAADRDK